MTRPSISVFMPIPGSPVRGWLRVRRDCVRRVQIHKHLQKMGLIIPILLGITGEGFNAGTHRRPAPL
jgi:hypothetical protein